MKYGILGASLSEQTLRHDTGEPVGYVEFLRRNHAAGLGTTPEEIRAYTYAGARMGDAGLVRLQELLADPPDVCIVEPLVEDTSKGRWAQPVEIRTIYKQLMAAGIVPVTFFVGLPDHVEVSKFPVTAPIRRICQTFGLPIIEADIAAIKATGAEFSGVHTKADSGTALAAQLAEGLARLDIPALRRQILARPEAGADMRGEMQVARAQVPDTRDLRRICLDITPERPGPYSLRVVLEQSIGPQAPVIRSRVMAQDDSVVLKTPQQISVWDQYCHYDRNAFTVLLADTGPFTRPIWIEIEVTRNDPDYTVARRPRDNWPGPAQRCLRPRGPVVVISDQPVQARIGAVTPLKPGVLPHISVRDNPDLSCQRPRSSVLSRLRESWRQQTRGPQGG